MNNLATRYALMTGFDRMVLALSILIVGSLAVMIALALIAWVTSLLEGLESSAAQVPAQPAAEPHAAAQLARSAPALDSNLDPTIIAVITASIAALLTGRRFRIHQIRMAGGPSSTAWGQAGRQSIHASHAIERKTR